MKKILQTKRLYCRPFEDTKGDLELLRSLFDNKEVMKYYPDISDVKKHEPDWSVENTLKKWVGQDEKYNTPRWVVFLKDGDRFIGRTGFSMKNQDKDGNYIEDKSRHKITLSYAFLPEFWGKGYATEIGRVVIAWIWKNISGLDKIHAGADERNFASQGVLEKLGFEFLGKGEFKGLKVKKYVLKRPSLINRYVKNGKLVGFPSKRNLQIKVLEKMKNWFEVGKKYSEKEVNEIIKNGIESTCNRDYVTLRRDMIDLGLLIRKDSGNEYWRSDEKIGS